MKNFLRRCATFVSGVARRFVAAQPQNVYERAVFTAVRTILLRAFIKPLRGLDHEYQVAGNG